MLFAISCALVAALAAKLARKRQVGLVCGLLFAVHPVHVEAVASIANRKDVLAMIFVALAVLAWSSTTGWRRIGLTAACYALGLASKEIAAAALPLMLALGAVYFPHRPTALSSATGRGVRGLGCRAPRSLRTAVRLGSPRECFRRGVGLPHHRGAGPELHGLARHVDGRVCSTPALALLPLAAEPRLPGACPSGLLRHGRTGRCAPLVPVGRAGSGHAPPSASRFVRDALGPGHARTEREHPPRDPVLRRRPLPLSLPSFGACLLASSILVAAPSRLVSERSRKPLAVAVLLGLVLVLGARSVLRVFDWRSTETLVAAAERDGFSTWRIEHMSGVQARRAGEHQVAIEHFERAVDLAPNVHLLRLDLGRARLASPGSTRGAIAPLTAATQLRPRDPIGHALLGDAHQQLGELSLATRSYGRAQEFSPADPSLCLKLGLLLDRLGRPGEASPQFERFVELSRAALAPPLAFAYERIGQNAEALSVLSRLLEREPNNLRLRVELTRLLANGSDPELRGPSGGPTTGAGTSRPSTGTGPPRAPCSASRSFAAGTRRKPSRPTPRRGRRPGGRTAAKRLRVGHGLRPMRTTRLLERNGSSVLPAWLEGAPPEERRTMDWLQREARARVQSDG